MQVVIGVSLLIVVPACTKAGEPANGVSTAQHTAAMAVTSSSPSPTPIANPKIRAAGESEFGKLEIRSRVQENVEQLGAPSCYGTAVDYKISGTYNVQFTDKANTVTELAISSLAGFIQPRNETLPLQKLAFPGHDIFVITPNYKDCHGISFYLVDVSEEGAFLLQFLTPEGKSDQYDFLPKTELKVEQGLLKVQHGGGAGNETVIEQHFKPDFAKHVMEIVS